MTISTTTSRQSYNGNGVTTVFSVPFRFFQNADLVVQLVTISTGASTTLVLGTHYTVSGADAEAGGSVTMVTPPAVGQTIVIRRVIAATQEVDYVAGDPFPAETHERALDRLTMISQQGEEVNSRSLTLPAGDTTSGEIPQLFIRANKLLAFDSAGRPTVVNPATDSATDVRIDLASTASGKGAEMVGSDDGAGGSLWATVAGFIARIVSSAGASLIGFIQSGAGAVAMNLQAAMRERVTVGQFGAIGGGSDDTAKIQAAIDAVPAGGVVVGDRRLTYTINGRVDLMDKELRDIRIAYGDNAAMLVMGGNAKLKSTVISVGATIRPFAGPLAGVINLHLATGVVIDDVEITDGISDRIGVFCSTLASDTHINKLRANYIGWPVLFNDNVPAQRIVDAVDYAGQSIGSGLVIENSELGASDKTAVGDAVEINCPSARFTDLEVKGCKIKKTVSSAVSNGLGIGAAMCDGVQIVGNTLSAVPVSAGAVHVEGSTDVMIDRNIIKNCKQSIGLGVDGSDTVVSGNIIRGCEGAIQAIGSAASFDGLTIDGNQITDTLNYPIVLLNCKGSVIARNRIKNIVGATASFISMQQTGALVSAVHQIEGNVFSVTNGNHRPLFSTVGTNTEVMSRDNLFNGVSGGNRAAYLQAIRAVGMATDHYSPAGNTSAINATMTVDPTGYVTGAAGDMVTDVNAGVIYKHDGTAWVSKVA